ncbi:MAG: VWA domain-containing protein [Vicinamibacterales bacterium]
MRVVGSISGRPDSRAMRWLLLLVSLVAVGSVAPSRLMGQAPVRSQTLAVQITSPLGRTGMTGPIRIVARITSTAGTTLSPVQFFVDGKLVGEDKDGAPYAVEWLDENPLAPRQIVVQVADSSGATASDLIDLKPLEVTARAQVSSVLLEPSVREPGGRPVNGLGLSDFQVFEDGVPQTTELGAVDTVPAVYTLLIDGSQSMSRRMDFVRDAAQQLPLHLRPNDEVIVVPFTLTLGTITGPTKDRETIAGAIQSIQAKGGTAILDCLTSAAKQLNGGDARHVIVLVTDGYDENSAISFDEALAAVRASRATVYVIGVGGVAGISLKGEDLLKRLAADTGGRAFFPAREFQLSDVHGLIAADVQQRYALTYTPTNQKPDGTWRSITVTTSNPRNIVTVRSGYKAPAPPPIQHQVELTVRDLTRQHLDVTPDDFAVFEDGVEQKIVGFEEALTPVSIMLVLDQSGSMKNDAPAVTAAARSFARQLPGKDHVGVMLFADRPELVQDLSAVREWILRAVDQYHASGGTALYDALSESVARLKKVEGRTAIVVLTDGRDENNPGTAPGSIHTLDDVLTTLQAVGTTVYAIGLGPKVDRATLERLATSSSGEAYFPEAVTSLDGEYRRILENLRRRYVLSYTSTNSTHDGAWRHVEIRPTREGLAVQAEDGYLAPDLQ